MHSRAHAFLTHPRSPGGDTVPDNCCWKTADRRKSQCSNCIVHRRLWVKVHKIFHTCRAPRGTVYRESLTGVRAENFERITKNREFLHLYMQKRALRLPRGSKVKVEHTPRRPLSYGSTAVLSVQKFASVPELEA